jgi:hypothetical protein
MGRNLEGTLLHDTILPWLVTDDAARPGRVHVSLDHNLDTIPSRNVPKGLACGIAVGVVEVLRGSKVVAVIQNLTQLFNDA